MRLVLASASPRRKELMAQLKLTPDILPAHIDESVKTDEHAYDYVARMADGKARCIVERLKASPSGSLSAEDSECIVIGADTTIALGDEIIGKPRDKADFMKTMMALSGKTHQVLTAISLIKISSSQDGEESGRVSQVVSTDVEFKVLSPEEMEIYWASGEPFDKAGGYGIQWLGAKWVKRINGCYFAVVGLPLSALSDALKQLGAESI